MFPLQTARQLLLDITSLGLPISTENVDTITPQFPNVFFCFFVFVSLSYHTTHITTAGRRAEKRCRRRGASSGQKTKRGIEGEDPAAAFLSTSHKRLLCSHSRLRGSFCSTSPAWACPLQRNTWTPSRRSSWRTSFRTRWWAPGRPGRARTGSWLPACLPQSASRYIYICI